MKYSKIVLLDKAIEITKAYATSGGSSPVSMVLEKVYEQLKKLNDDVE